MKYLEGLNNAQTDAVTHTEGPLLIVAGAGAGKTKTITHRILHLVKSGVAPQRILAITFTNKAANEMQERVNALLAHDDGLNTPVGFVERPFVSTFHRLGIHIIRAHADRLGLTKSFSIFDRDDSLRAMKRAIKACDLDPKNYEPKKFLSLISRKKGEAVSLDQFIGSVTGSYSDELLRDIWSAYEDILRKEKALDFDDLLLRAVELLRGYDEIREHYEQAWSHVHIDEYQDTNKVQYELSRLLTSGHNNVCVVGDADQTIYGWRGADIKNILNFEKDYENTKVILLQENYRSTKNILDAANAVIEKNEERVPKDLITRKTGGEKIVVGTCFDEREEAEFVANHVRRLLREGVEAQEIAVLYRANFQSRILEESMLRNNLPYQVLGTRFYDRREVKDVLAYIRAARNPDSFSDFERIVNVPPRGIGKVTVAKIAAGKEDALTAAMRDRVSVFKTSLARIRKFSDEEKVSDTIKFVVRESGLEEALRDGDEEDQERLENIKELATLATRYDEHDRGVGIEMFLEDVALASEQDSLDHARKEKKNAVKLMTVHASKGLEFDYVFVVGLEDGLFPHTTDDEKEGREGQRRKEEERRLFYVAITRARHKLFLSYASQRTIFGQRDMQMPSEFLGDIPDDLCEIEDHGSIGEPSSEGSNLLTVYWD